MHQPSRNGARRTYTSLHWLMVMLPAVLFAVSVGSAVASGQFPTSISAFYGGPVRDVFVGALIALAACMIAYQGTNAVEHYNLKGAAFYAVFVALVPTGLDEIFSDLRGQVALSGVTPSEYVWSMRFSLTIAAGICVALIGYEVRRINGQRRHMDRLAIGFVGVTLGALAGFLRLAMWQLWAPEADAVTMGGIFQLRIHDIAAIFLLSALAVAVWSHAWPRASARRSGEGVAMSDVALQTRYRVIFALMLLGPAAAWGLSTAFAPDHFVLILEWWEIALFGAFWIFEARRLRRK